MCNFEGDNLDLLLFSTSPVIEKMLFTGTDPAHIPKDASVYWASESSVVILSYHAKILVDSQSRGG